MDAKSVQQHDDVYAAVFALVGQKPNETYEGLARVLPSIKDADPAELKELEARKALLEMMKPSVDPLREEYEKAAAEEEVDDLSTEEGDWSFQPGENDEELDDNGIPVMKLSRASSSFILDGPGDVKVDNFTPEGNVLGNLDIGTGYGTEKAAASVPPATATDCSPIATVEPAAYTPSVMARSRRDSGAGTRPPLAPAALVVTLEDEIRAMRAASGPAATSGAATGDHNDTQQPQPQLQQVEAEGEEGSLPLDGQEASGDKEEKEDDASEVVPEPQGALVQPAGGGGVGAGGRRGRGSNSGGGGVTRVLGPGGEGLAAAAAAAVAAAGGIGGCGSADEATYSLPGTCQDTQHEDAVWAALQGVDGRALLEDLGLAGSFPMASLTQNHGQDQGCTEDQVNGGPRGLVVSNVDRSSQLPRDGEGEVVAAANGHQYCRIDGEGQGMLANGHSGEGASSSRSIKSSSSGGDAGDATVANGYSDNRAAVAAEDGRETITAAAVSAGGGGGTSNGEIITAAEAAGSEVAMVTGAALVPAPGGPCRPPQSPSVEAPTFEEVEAFSLDPDFDYDNVQLTVREFPYSALNFRVRQ